MINIFTTYNKTYIRFRESIYLLIILLFLGNGIVYGQFDIPPKPTSKTKQTAVYDDIGLLNSYQQKSLELKWRRSFLTRCSMGAKMGHWTS